MSSKNSNFDISRPRGILTKTDREFLLGDGDLASKQATYNARSRIRERVLNGILDFSILFHHLDNRDLKQIFDPDEIKNAHELRRGMRDAIALFFMETWMGKYDDTVEPFDILLQEAVWAAKGRRDDIDKEHFFNEVVARLVVSFDVHEPEPVNAIQVADKIRRYALYELTDREFRFYVYVQSRTKGEVREGPTAAKEFLDNVDSMTKKGNLDRPGE